MRATPGLTSIQPSILEGYFGSLSLQLALLALIDISSFCMFCLLLMLINKNSPVPVSNHVRYSSGGACMSFLFNGTSFDPKELEQDPTTIRH
jgi:hypothetical protein